MIQSKWNSIIDIFHLIDELRLRMTMNKKLDMEAIMFTMYGRFGSFGIQGFW